MAVRPPSRQSIAQTRSNPRIVVETSPLHSEPLLAWVGVDESRSLEAPTDTNTRGGERFHAMPLNPRWRTRRHCGQSGQRCRSPIPYFFLLWRASAKSNPALINRMINTIQAATRRMCPTKHGIVPPQASRVACGLLRCHYRRSARQAMEILSETCLQQFYPRQCSPLFS
jgi:hypothetical protein